MSEEVLGLVAQMRVALDIVNALKAQPQLADPRGMAVAATHLETAILWVVNARKQ